MITVPSAKVFVLPLLSWNTEVNEAVSAEFASRETCEAATVQAKRTFTGEAPASMLFAPRSSPSMLSPIEHTAVRPSQYGASFSL